MGLLALLAYVPALASSPGRMPADTKLYLYLDPDGLWGRAASTFEPDQFAGWVPHQQITYLWPSGPWYWLFDIVGVPDWIAHRLWLGTLLLAAGAGVRWAGRLLGLAPVAALTAAVVYQTTPYLLPYVSRTSLLLLPWAGLGWILALTLRGCAPGGSGATRPGAVRRLRAWRDPALIALVVATVGSVNAAALLLVAPAPALWLVHAGWARLAPWRQVIGFAVRTVALCVVTALWWVAMSVVQARHGAPVLAFSETLADVSRNSTGSEVLRGLGYWLFYIRDPAGPATTASIDYLVRTGGILVSYAVVVVGLCGLAVVRWPARRFAALCVAVGMVLAVGVHPIDDPSPLVSLLVPDDGSGLALALRSSTRAVPVLVLGVALGAGALVAVLPAAAAGLRRPPVTVRTVGAAAVIGLAVLNLPALWSFALVDPAIDRDAQPPEAWSAAAATLDRGADDHRVLQVPGAEFGAFRWGYTVDQPVVGLTDRPLVTRDLLPLGSAAMMDLLYALDDRVQEGWFEIDALAPVARLLAADRVWLANDAAFDRFRTARPEPLSDVIADAAGSSGIGTVAPFGEPAVNVPEVAMVDEEAIADPTVGTPLPPVELVSIEGAPPVVRAKPDSVVVSGSGDGIVDAAAAGLLDGTELVRYSAAIGPVDLDGALADAGLLVVTDSNRDRAHHWRGSQDVHGHTEPGGPADDVLVETAADRRLDVFGSADAGEQTVAVQTGPVVAVASAYGEPFAYRPEDRAAMAVDGDPDTAWTVADHGDPVGERLRLSVDAPTDDELVLHQVGPDPGGRVIEALDITVDGGDPFSVALEPASWQGGQTVPLPAPATTVVEIEITAASMGDQALAASRAGVGFIEVDLGLPPTVEVVRPPRDALDAAAGVPLALVLTRLRTEPTDRWRADPERELIRGFDLPDARELSATVTLRLDPRAADPLLAEALRRPVADGAANARTRLVGAPDAGGPAVLDGDPDTAWITPFDGADGAALEIHTADGVGPRLTVRQPDGPFSPVRRLRFDTPSRSIEVDVPPPGPDGTSEVSVGTPLRGPVTLTVTEVDRRTTVDRRYGDVVALPAAISEIEGSGLARLADDAARPVRATCDGSLLRVDGEPVPLSYSTTVGELLAGEPVTATPCGGPLALAAGDHLVVSTARSEGLTVDRVVLADADLSDRVGSELVAVRTDHHGARRRVVTVDPCPEGCWLVLGEGFNPAWEATLEGSPLGDPELVDGGANGWWLPPASEARTVTFTWEAQRPVTLGLAASLVGVLACLAVVVATLVADGRSRARPLPAPRSLRSSDPSGGIAPLLRAGAVVAVAGSLLVDVRWAAAAAVVTGAAIVVRHRWPRHTLGRRPFEWAAVAAAVTVAVAVAYVERRDAPAPDAGWTAAVDRLHGLAVFAVLLLAAGAVTARDAGGDVEPDAGETDR